MIVMVHNGGLTSQSFGPFLWAVRHIERAVSLVKLNGKNTEIFILYVLPDHKIIALKFIK